jgi:predicted O-linked N-acetylglucosamine transferase (SPINDLY family)
LGQHATGAWFPFPLQDDPAAALARQARVGAVVLGNLGLAEPTRAPLPPPHLDGKIRVGYFSNDFYTHATMFLLNGVFRHHDRARFELHCFDYGRNDALGTAIKSLCDYVHHIQDVPRDDVVALAREVGLDIAVDLKGETTGARTDLFPLGLAPVQINYLGFPGSMGTPAYDYIIGDDVVIPPELEAHYAERVVRLPTCYLPSDDTLRHELPPTRAELGLPTGAVVLACLNEHYKISRALFAIWLDALKTLPNTVLWLLDGPDEAKANLLRSAAAAGVAPERIIFADKRPHQQHVTRLAQADLYLDTFHVNGHTLSADALCYAHVPLLTRAGQQFAARVGASFATAAGLSDLVATTSEEYRSKLLDLASNPAALTQLRGRVALARGTQPMFSSKAYTGFLEEAFTIAHSRARQGLPAQSFSVAASPN